MSRHQADAALESIFEPAISLAATGSRRRAESRTEATSHFARAACLVFCVAVIVCIVFDLVLRHRMLAANTVGIIFEQPNSPKRTGQRGKGLQSPARTPTGRGRDKGPASPSPRTKSPSERLSTFVRRWCPNLISCERTERRRYRVHPECSKRELSDRRIFQSH